MSFCECDKCGAAIGFGCGCRVIQAKVPSSADELYASRMQLQRELNLALKDLQSLSQSIPYERQFNSVDGCRELSALIRYQTGAVSKIVARFDATVSSIESAQLITQ